MTTPHRTLQMALDALDAITDDVDGTGLNTMPSFDKAIDAIAALREALAPDHLRDVAEKAAPAEDFCYCDDDISLQMVSGGAALEGLYGRVTLKINGQYVDYVKAQPAPAEHVAWCKYEQRHERPTRIVLCDSDEDGAFRVYAAPPAAQPAPVPLTDLQLSEIAVSDEFLLYCSQDEFNEIARAIERAHGIAASPEQPK